MAEKRWKRRFLSSQSLNSVPLPPRKHPRISALKSSPPHAIIDDTSESLSVPESPPTMTAAIYVHDSSDPTFCDPDDLQEQAFRDHDDHREHDCVPVWEVGRKLDPEYGFFCDNVREEEKGFVLEIAAEDDAMPLTIRYEVSAHGSSGGLVAKTPKAVRIGMETMEELPCSAKRNTLDGDARDTCVSQGNGLAIDCVRVAKDTCFSDGDGLAGEGEMPVSDREGTLKLDPSYKCFLEKLNEEVKGYKLDVGAGKEAVPLVISYETFASRFSNGFAAKTPKAAMIGSEKMGSHDLEVPCSTERNSLDVMEENNAILDNDSDAKDTCFSDGDGLSGDFEMLVNGWEGSWKLDPSYKFFLENLKEEAKGYKLDIAVGEEAVPLVISYKMSASGFSNGFVAKSSKASHLGTEKMGSHDVEVPCRAERNSLDIMEQKSARFDDDAEDTIERATQAIGYCDGVVVETPEVVRNGTGDVGSHHEEVPCSCRRSNLEVMDMKNAVLDDDGDAEDTHIADGDGLTVNCEILANSRYLDETMAETETQNVVSNETQDVGCHHEEVTLSTERVVSVVMEEKNTWLGQVGDAKYNCTAGESLEAIDKKARLDDDGDAEDMRIADGDGLTVNYEILANNRCLDGIVAETETQNVVSNETRDMGCHHEEVTLSTERVGLEVMEENEVGIDHHGDTETECDERHSSEVMEENTWLDQVGDAKYYCTEGESLEAFENLNARSVGDGAGDNCVSDCDCAIEVNFGSDSNGNAEGNCVSDSNDQTKNNCASHGDGGIEVSGGISGCNNTAKGNCVSDCGDEEKDNCVSDCGDEVKDDYVFHGSGYGGAKDNYVSDGIVSESETHNVVSNETHDIGCHHEEVTLSTERVGSEVMEENNAGIDHDGDGEAKCDERHEEKNIWLGQVGVGKYNCTKGENLEAIENMNAISVDDDDGGDGDYSVSDCDHGIEVSLGSDFNGNTEGHRVSDSIDLTKNNCVSDGDGGIEVKFGSDCNNNAKGNCVSDCNDEEKDNCVFHGNGYGEAKDNSVSDDVDANANCAPDCDADCDPKNKGSSEVNGEDSEHCASDGDEAKYPCDSDKDDVENHCVSDGDDVNEHCASGEDDIRYHSVSDADDVNEHCASGEDDIRYHSASDADDVDYYCLSDDDDAIDSCVSISGTSKYDLDSDATVDECYKLFLHHLKPDGETVDFQAHNGKTKRDDHNDGAGSDEEEKPKIDGLKSPFPSFRRKSNTGCTAASARAKLSKYTDKLKFREELMYALKKPYDQNEYEKLWDKISMRAPVQHRRVLRGKTKMYSTNHVGKSYLDHHPDLALVIKSVEKDEARVLNQLRGFFYWLKNLSCQGAFIPWKDSVCLEILPET